MSDILPLSESAQDVACELFAGVVAEKDAPVAAILRQKLAIVGGAGHTPDGHLSPDQRAALAALFAAINKEGPAFAARVAAADARMVDVAQRVRKAAGIMAVNAIDSLPSIRMGDTFVEIMERCCRANLSAADVQALMPFAGVWPSLTTHPTNPMSFQYTAAGFALDRVVADPATTRTQLLAGLRTLRDTPMEHDVVPGTGQPTPKKTPALEIQELLLALNVLYDTVAGPQRQLRRALDRFGYHAVRVTQPLVDLNVWGAGDGDGNPNMGEPELRAQLQALRSAVTARYLGDLQHPSLDFLFPVGGFAAEKEKLISLLHGGRVSSQAELVATFRSLRKTLEEPAARRVVGGQRRALMDAAQEHLDSLVMKAEAFGLHFARTDVRHNSVDVMETAAAVLHALGAVPNREAFQQAPSTAQCDVMRPLFDDAALRQKAAAWSAADVKTLLGASSPTAARIFSRMRVIAEFPEMFQKIIIAETRSAANAVAVLLLLRLAGNVVAAPGASISVVPLFESREDLREAPATFHALATDPTFASHLQQLGYFLAMIAKSDTTRLSGPGVQGRQEETVARLMSIHPASYGGVKMCIFAGGGDDQMRGGGRIVETPHVLTLAANRHGAHHPARFALTIQGMQMQLVFGSTLLASHFIEAFAAQQMLAAARMLGMIRFRPVPSICSRAAASHSAHDFFREAMNHYEAMVGAIGSPRRQTIVDYFAAFPSAIITAGNKSSRPMSRKKTDDPLQGRAISLDQLAKHDGGYVTATLGVAAALRLLRASLRSGAPEPTSGGAALCPLRHTYLANKSFRDFVRMQAVVLFQKDFNVAWGSRGGRPASDEEHRALVAEHAACVAANKPAPPRAFLAYVESEDRAAAAMLLESITGVPPAGPTSLEQPLAVGWPDLAHKMAFRARLSALAQLFESQAVMRLREGAQPPATPHDAAIGYFAYVGVNPRFSTPSFALTYTDPQKEGKLGVVETSPEVRQRMAVSLWARRELGAKL